MVRRGANRRNNGPRNGPPPGSRDYPPPRNGRSPPRRSSPPRYHDRPRDSYDRPPQNGSDSWRPGDRHRRDDHRQNRGSDRPPLYDGYRPQPQMPQGDFTFSVPKPAGISDQPPPSFPRNRDRPNDRRGGRRDARGRGRGGRGGRGPPPHPAERALLTGRSLKPTETRLDGDEPAKFRNLNEISDDDELDMEISSRSSDGSSTPDPDAPSKKRARTNDVASAEAAEAPKWSNPDPYTALPCPDGSQKKRDVVQLIRKARLEEDKKPAATTEAENFISFDSTDDEKEGSDNDDESSQPVNSQKPSPPYEPPPYEPPPPLPPGPPPPGPPTGSYNGSLEPNKNGSLGSRKRTADDEIKPPNYQVKKAPGKAGQGTVVADWMPKRNEEPCPWATVDHSGTRDMAFRLHKEVVDFYEYVRPRQFEQRIRDQLVDNLRKAMKRDGRNFATASVHPFGSFMSGLYLPTADMDLVVCSASFMRGGLPIYTTSKNQLYKFKRFLETQYVADGHSIQVIAHARVPLVKYVDKTTGLRVDVSFENMGGVGAVDTFLDWKKRYPAMPILVTVIKHFLLMRGLNEPVNGGIGGFSVICLVVSMLQLMPQVQSRSMIPEHHLGEMLLEFMDLYGRRFRYDNVAIRLTGSPGYVRKSKVLSLTYRNMDRFSIIDPCNPNNDISGGSSNTSVIIARFEDCYHTLRQRMEQIGKEPDQRKNGGILDVIMKGDYSSFRKQRDFLRLVHEKTIGPCED